MNLDLIQKTRKFWPTFVMLDCLQPSQVGSTPPRCLCHLDRGLQGWWQVLCLHTINAPWSLCASPMMLAKLLWYLTACKSLRLSESPIDAFSNQIVALKYSDKLSADRPIMLLCLDHDRTIWIRTECNKVHHIKVRPIEFDFPPLFKTWNGFLYTDQNILLILANANPSQLIL